MLSKLRNDPFGFVRRAFYKLFIAPLKYRSKNGYDAQRYWRDRFEKYGLSLRGVGDEGLSEEENRKMYEEAGRNFLSLCQQEGIDFPSVSALEIGCGSGFYTGLLAEQGVGRYTGVDITDVFFPELCQRHPGFEFRRLDVTRETIAGKFDLVAMIDVIEHITDEGQLAAAFEHVKQCLAPGGLLVLAPVSARGRRSLFYVRFWELDDIKSSFHGYRFSELLPFRYSNMVAIRKPFNGER